MCLLVSIYYFKCLLILYLFTNIKNGLTVKEAFTCIFKMPDFVEQRKMNGFYTCLYTVIIISKISSGGLNIYKIHKMKTFLKECFIKDELLNS